MKKVWTMVLIVLVMVIGMTSTISAATTSDVIAALKAGNVPETYIAQAESYFASHPLTAAQADQIVAAINAAADTADGETHLSKLSAAQRTAIINDIKTAAKAIGLTATYADKAITVKDSSNQTVFTVTSQSAIKQTGNDYTIVFAGIALMILAGGAALIARKAVKNI